MTTLEKLDESRDRLMAAHPDREVWWLPECDGTRQRVTWHSRPRGAPNADLHAGTAEELARRIAASHSEDS